jgi:hypothetical protein
MRNNKIFGDGKASIQCSSEFLDNYAKTLGLIKHVRAELGGKGKKPVSVQKQCEKNECRSGRKSIFTGAPQMGAGRGTSTAVWGTPA